MPDQRLRIPFLSSSLTAHPGFQLFLLLLWTSIGAILRFSHLGSKPLWTDEFATLVFSLGHSFETVLLDRIISLDALLQPLQLAPVAGTQAVLQFLLTEDVHPPLYFVLSNVWLRSFSANTGLVSVELARSLPALLGTASIPAMFGLSWLVLRSPAAGQLTAAMMAVSPFGVYLAQEARHYTLGILWVIASLCCLGVTLRLMQHNRPLPLWLGALWILINGLGIATHYFFILSLGAMAIALLGLGIRQARTNPKIWLTAPWRRIYGVMLGTAMTALVWLPILQSIRSREITQWIQNDQPFNWLDLVNPIVQSIAAWTTMIILLPVEADHLGVAIVAGTGMVLFILWAIPQLYLGLRQALLVPATGGVVSVMLGVVLGAIALFFLIAYGLRTDITRGARYSFVYFPAVILLVGTSLAALWDRPPQISVDKPSVNKPSVNKGIFATKRAVILIGLFALLSSLTVVNNLGYRKYYRPELLVQLIQARSTQPVLIATTHQTLVQTGEMMGLGWQLSQQPLSSSAQFLLAHELQNPCEMNCPATIILKEAIAETDNPIDVWLVNFHAPVSLDPTRCRLDQQPRPYVSGYSYQEYHCGPSSAT
jgi:uncharacterized membrane protein